MNIKNYRHLVWFLFFILSEMSHNSRHRMQQHRQCYIHSSALLISVLGKNELEILEANLEG